MTNNDPAEHGPDLLVAIDHHGAKVHQLDGDAEDRSLVPYDPHGFRHHLTHVHEDREAGQRASEDLGFYEKIAQTLAGARRIVIVGHGHGHSNAATRLMEWLRSHHRPIAARATELSADLSALTPNQLAALGRETLR